MRRAGLVLAGLGTCLIVFALLQAFWVTGQVIYVVGGQHGPVSLGRDGGYQAIAATP